MSTMQGIIAEHLDHIWCCQVSKAINFVAEQVTDINQRVMRINKADTDKIEAVPLIPGPPGIKGIDG